MQPQLKWTPWSPLIDVGFWTTLSKKKIEEYKLSSDQKPFFARYKLPQQPDPMASLTVDAFSFEELNGEKMGQIEIQIKGKFINTNTVQQFKATNLDQQEDKLRLEELENARDFIEGKATTLNPALKIVIFADLKKYLFSYYFLAASVAVKNFQTLSIQPLKEKVQLNEVLNKALKSFIINSQKSTRLVVLRRSKDEDYSKSNIKQFVQEEGYQYLFAYLDTLGAPSATSIHTSSLLALFALLRSEHSSISERLKKTRILLIKDFMVYNLQRNYKFSNSQIWTVDLSKVELDNEKKLTQPRKLMELDLKTFMDQKSMYRDAVDLNIKLMKWRMLPRLDIQKIHARKVLLFGAGTLGCQLARNLIGWGIKHISFVDYSNVSYSNPVRQSLYEYEDTTKGGRPKAIVAAQKLKKIHPQIESQGYHISVPMPGHFVTSQKQIEDTFKNLDIIQNLVKQHDACFLLLDSRQARWLPTLLANKYDKACITVGLGFDSFLIVRHGVSPLIYDPVYHKQRLSCYFCNDIATPQNTMKDRTLDQMCTVTRPGLSFVSSAYASELYISLIHHDLQHRVWADQDRDKLQTTDLGKLPHHIRGNMSDFEINMFYGKAFDQCVACSRKVLDEYTNNREEFMLSILNDPQFIHKVTGMDKVIAEMQLNTNDFIQILGDSDEQTAEISENPVEKQLEQKKE